jgi:hypothetical protein
MKVLCCWQSLNNKYRSRNQEAIYSGSSRCLSRIGQKDGTAKRWSVIPWFLFFCPTIFLPIGLQPADRRVEFLFSTRHLFVGHRRRVAPGIAPAMATSASAKTHLKVLPNRKSQPARFYPHRAQGRLVGLPFIQDSMNRTGSSADNPKI